MKKARTMPRFFAPNFAVKMGFSTASTFEFTGLRGFSRRSGGMIGWASYIYATHFETQRNSSDIAADLAKPEFVSSSFTVSTALPSLAQNSLASLYASPLMPIGGPNPTCGLFFAIK